MIAQLERSALGLVGSANVVLAAAYLDLIEGAVLILVVGAAVDGALDAGVGLIDHNCFLLVSCYTKSMPIERSRYAPTCIK